MYCINDSVINVVDGLDILDNVDVVCFSAHAVNKPVGSSVCDCTSADALNDWVGDGYRWIINGTVKLPRRSPHMCK